MSHLQAQSSNTHNTRSAHAQRRVDKGSSDGASPFSSLLERAGGEREVDENMAVSCRGCSQVCKQFLLLLWKNFILQVSGMCSVGKGWLQLPKSEDRNNVELGSGD